MAGGRRAPRKRRIGMGRGSRVLVCAVGAACFVRPVLAADLCQRSGVEWQRPTRVGLNSAALGVAAGTCAHTSVALSSSASALLAREDFYGTLRGNLGLWLRLALASNTWVSLELPGLDYVYSANATIVADRVSLGPGSIGWHVAFPITDTLRVAPFLRLLVPTETGYSRARRFGWEQGLSSSLHLGGRWVVATTVSFPFSTTHNSGTWLNDFRPAASVEALYHLAESWGISLGGSLRLQPPQSQPVLGSFSGRGGVRTSLFGSGFVEVAAELPVAGADRTDLYASLHMGWMM